MTIYLANGQTVQVDGAAHIVLAHAKDTYNPDDPNTWEDDRAWAAARVGRLFVTDNNEVHEIVRVG